MSGRAGFPWNRTHIFLATLPSATYESLRDILHEVHVREVWVTKAAIQQLLSETDYLEWESLTRALSRGMFGWTVPLREYTQWQVRHRCTPTHRNVARAAQPPLPAAPKIQAPPLRKGGIRPKKAPRATAQAQAPQAQAPQAQASQAKARQAKASKAKASQAQAPQAKAPRKAPRKAPQAQAPQAKAPQAQAPQAPRKAPRKASRKAPRKASRKVPRKVPRARGGPSQGLRKRKTPPRSHRSPARVKFTRRHGRGQVPRKEVPSWAVGAECANCGAVSTGCWRHGKGGCVLCNACGLFWHKWGLDRNAANAKRSLML